MSGTRPPAALIRPYTGSGMRMGTGIGKGIGTCIALEGGRWRRDQRLAVQEHPGADAGLPYERGAGTG